MNEETRTDAHGPGISWGAVLGGAAASAALSLILLVLGVGLGLSAVSPWAFSAEALGVSTLVWLALTQLAASGLGGYLAGRLRSKWTRVHLDEVHFRDTAHGLLTWSVATLLTASVLVGAASSIAGKAAMVGGGLAAAGAATAAAGPPQPSGEGMPGPGGAPGDPLTYYSDMLLRSDAPPADANPGALNREVLRIFLADVPNGRLPPEDRDYLAKQVAKRSGLSDGEAQARVDDVYGRASKAFADGKQKAQDAADEARKATAHSALWMFVALLFGAFTASLAGTFGGRQRDHKRVYAVAN